MVGGGGGRGGGEEGGGGEGGGEGERQERYLEKDLFWGVKPPKGNRSLTLKRE